MQTSISELKKRFLELLRSDWEFRRAVAAELGLQEILERMDRMEERMARLEERMIGIEKTIKEHTKAIRELSETVREHSKAIEKLTKRIEEHSRVLEEHSKAIEKLTKRVEEHTKIIEGLTKTVEEHTRILREHSKAIEKLTKRIEEHSRVLEEHSKAIEKLTRAVEEHSRAISRLERGFRRLSDRINALGARWGVVSERTVRRGLHRFLKEYFGVASVGKWRFYDREGLVYGYPAYVEIDVIVKDNVHYLVEVRSSVSVGDVLVFDKICNLYTEKTGIESVKKVMITYYIREKALEAARKYGIEVITS